MSYYDKYQKYKMKYLELKKLSLNTTTTKINLSECSKDGKTFISLICTHSARLRCFMMDIVKDVMIKLLNENKVKEIRFKNVCILEMKIDCSGASLKMVFSGFITKENRKGIYFTIGKNYDNDFLDGDIIFPELNISLTSLKLNQEIIKNNTFIFYIIRHGEGFHNVAKISQKVMGAIKGIVTENKLQDALLTDKGKKDAAGAGEKLREMIGNKKIDFLFASKLRRTRETLKNIIGNNNFSYESQLPNNIIILPCSHELEFKDGGNCDENQSIFNNPENTQKCYNDGNFSSINEELCDNITLSTGKPILINWNIYTNYKKDKNKKCSNTNMIKEAIEYIIKNK